MTLNCIIIDDSFFVRETLSAMIEKEGHAVSHRFESGEEFLESIEYVSPDLIFLDIILPKMSGLEILNSIKEYLPMVKVIMLSGMAQGKTISAALRLGATDFVSKPISKEQLSNLLIKFSDDISGPSVEKLSNIGVACYLITEFFSELTAHSTATLRDEIINQCKSILSDVSTKYPNIIIVNIEKINLEPNPELWGSVSETEVFGILKTIPIDLKSELNFLYPEEYITTLFDQAVMTLASRGNNLQLFEYVPSTKIGLPKIPHLLDPNLANIERAGASTEELERAISISVYYSGDMGPKISAHINQYLLDENDVLKNNLFYSTLVVNDENFQEGLFGPLPVSVRSDISIAALVYATRIQSYEEKVEKIILISIFFTPSADQIVSDQNKISFIIKTRLSMINWAEELDKVFARSIQSDTIQHIIER